MDKHEKVMELALRRGFLWPSYEIYGGASGFYDFGPLGATLKKNIEDKWREYYCVREGFLEIHCPTIAPEEVFIASGHVSNFVDPMTECKKCGSAFKASELIKESLKVKTDGLSHRELDEIIKEKKLKCPDCGSMLSRVWSYNLMFKTYMGPGNRKIGYLRPETAQGMFLLFNRLYGFHRKKLPFGVAQLGKAYRNEISPRQGIIRLREFSQAEVELFVHPDEKKHSRFKEFAREALNLTPKDGREKSMSAGEAVKKGIVSSELLAYHLVIAKKFLVDVGIPEKNIRFRQHMKTEIAHYAADCWDVEVLTERFGWIEVVGIADRTDFDLMAHEKQSGVELGAFVQYEKPMKVKMTVLEPDMAKIGPKYRGIAGKIIDAVASCSRKEIDSFIKNKYLELTVEGKKIMLENDELAVREKEKTVSGEKIIPHVIEPSYGIDRILYCILESAYTKKGERTIMKFRDSISPIKVAVFPLVAKEKLVKAALKILDIVKGSGILAVYDDSDSIGRRYARVDEIGVPYAITVDFEGLEDGNVTLRERDSTEQVRVKVKELPDIIKNLLDEKIAFKKLA